MTHILMSYAQADRATVARLVQVLEAQTWTVWWDRRMADEEPLEVFVSEFGGEPLCAIAVWSKRSVRARKLRRLAKEAQRLGILVSVRIDRVPLPAELRSRAQAFDLARWQGEPDHPGLETLLIEVARRLQTSADLTRVPRVTVPRGGHKGRLSLNLRGAAVLAVLLALAILALRLL